MSENTLFIPFGPGGNCHAERKILSNLKIDWWDYPALNSPENALETLLKSIIGKIDTMNGLITIIGNSYGGILATLVASRVPERIKKIKILASQPNLKTTYENLAKFFIKMYPNNLVLQKAFDEFNKEPNQNNFWTLVSNIVQIENFMDHYWYIKSEGYKKRKEMEGLGNIFLNFETFTNVMNSHFNSKNFTSLLANIRIDDIPVEIYIGSHDPFSEIELDKQAWQKIYPKAKFLNFECGHFMHFEVSPSKWC